MPESCRNCKADLTLSESVKRTYTQKRGPEDGSGDVSATGHYDSEGTFVNEEFEGFDSESSYDLNDDSDTCTNCNELI